MDVHACISVTSQAASKKSFRARFLGKFKKNKDAAEKKKADNVEPNDQSYTILKEIMADVEQRGINEEGLCRYEHAHW